MEGTDSHLIIVRRMKAEGWRVNDLPEVWQQSVAKGEERTHRS